MKQPAFFTARLKVFLAACRTNDDKLELALTLHTNQEEEKQRAAEELKATWHGEPQNWPGDILEMPWTFVDETERDDWKKTISRLARSIATQGRLPQSHPIYTGCLPHTAKSAVIDFDCTLAYASALIVPATANIRWASIEDLEGGIIHRFPRGRGEMQRVAKAAHAFFDAHRGEPTLFSTVVS